MTESGDCPERFSHHIFWVGALASSLLAGFLNLAIATLASPESHRDLLTLLTFLSVGVGTCLIAQVVVWLVAAPVLVRFGLDRSALAFAVAVFFVAFASLWPLCDLVNAPSPGGQLTVELAILSGALLSPTLAYVLAIGASEHVRARSSELAVAAPFLGASTLVFVWMQMFRIDGLTTSTSLTSIVLFGAAVLVIVALSLAFGGSVRPLSWLAVITVVVIAAPIPRLVGRRWSRSTLLPSANASLPVVLLLTVDTLRADAVEIEGEGASATPTLAALAAKSVVFEQARSPGSWTKPGVASLLTGVSPFVHGVKNRESRLPSEIQTLAEYLRERGYRTVAIGKNPFLQGVNFEQGFDEYRMYPRRAGSSVAGKLAPFVTSRFGRGSTESLTKMAMAWIRGNHERPFFLWLHYFDPHVPYAPDPTSLAGEAPPRIGCAFGSGSRIRGGTLVPQASEKQWIRRLYEAEVREVDRSMGRVFDTLRALGLFERALVVFTSDHGEEFWEHGGYGHGHALYDEVLRVPLFFKLPQSSYVTRISTRVSTASLTPTILDVLGFAVEGEFFTAKPLTSLWTQQSADSSSSPTITSGMLYYEEKTAVVFDDVKYIRSMESGAEELYDLTADPAEKRSVVDLLPQRLRAARELLERYVGLSSKAREALGLREQPPRRLDPELTEELRALGYLE